MVTTDGCQQINVRNRKFSSSLQTDRRKVALARASSHSSQTSAVAEFPLGFTKKTDGWQHARHRTFAKITILSDSV